MKYIVIPLILFASPAFATEHILLGAPVIVHSKAPPLPAPGIGVLQAGTIVAVHTTERQQYVPLMFVLVEKEDGLFEWFSVLEIRLDAKKAAAQKAQLPPLKPPTVIEERKTP
jgi:hypothetical protein